MAQQHVHHITTVDDFVTVATPENIDHLLADFRNYLLLAVHPEWREAIATPHRFNWLDDGAHNVFVEPLAWVESEDSGETGTVQCGDNHDLA